MMKVLNNRYLTFVLTLVGLVAAPTALPADIPFWPRALALFSLAVWLVIENVSKRSTRPYWTSRFFVHLAVMGFYTYARSRVGALGTFDWVLIAAHATMAAGSLIALWGVDGGDAHPDNTLPPRQDEQGRGPPPKRDHG